jgi:hypothetical protein
VHRAEELKEYVKYEDREFHKIIGKADISAAPLRLNSIEYYSGQFIPTVKGNLKNGEMKHANEIVFIIYRRIILMRIK